MNPESKIKVLAELDGFIPPSEQIPLWSHPNLTFGFLENRLPKYITSYDAIIPLVVKWCSGEKGRAALFFNQLMKLSYGNLERTLKDVWMLAATPEQLSDALIHATGKWQEE